MPPGGARRGRGGPRTEAPASQRKLTNFFQKAPGPASAENSTSQASSTAAGAATVPATVPCTSEVAAAEVGANRIAVLPPDAEKVVSAATADIREDVESPAQPAEPQGEDDEMEKMQDQQKRERGFGRAQMTELHQALEGTCVDSAEKENQHDRVEASLLKSEDNASASPWESNDASPGSTGKKLSLRERLLLRKGDTVAPTTCHLEPEKDLESSSPTSDLAREHKQLGGLDFKWRMLFHEGARKVTPAKPMSSKRSAPFSSECKVDPSKVELPRRHHEAVGSAEAADEGEAPSSSSQPGVATPCRGRAKAEMSPDAGAPEEKLASSVHLPLKRKSPSRVTDGAAAASSLDSCERSPKKAACDNDPFGASKLNRLLSGQSASKLKSAQDVDEKKLWSRIGGSISTCNIPQPGSSVKELRSFLHERSIDTSDCVERADLQALCDRFQYFLSKDIEELRMWCISSGADLEHVMDENVEKLAGLALKMEQDEHRQRSGTSPAPAGQVSSPAGHRGGPSLVASTSPASHGGNVHSAGSARQEGLEGSPRTEEALQEISRIKRLRRQSYATETLWAMSVLGVRGQDVAGVQRAHRNLMRKLHPDRIGALAHADETMEALQEAKACLERALSQRWPPSAPSKAQAVLKCAVPGKRCLELTWEAADSAGAAPVQKYTVAVFDPAYGKTLKVAVLEADYNEELKRFVPVEEICSYMLVERDFQKMPSLFRQSVLTVQISALNDAGQSPWTTLRVPLRQG